jgi:hypothetical protein
MTNHRLEMPWLELMNSIRSGNTGGKIVMAGQPVGQGGATGRYYYPKNEILIPRWEDSITDRPSKPWWLWVAALLLLLVCAIAAIGWAGSRSVNKATVLVIDDANNDGTVGAGDREATGCIIGRKGYVLTARHALMAPGEANCGKVWVWYLPGTPRCQRWEATLVEAGEPYSGSDAQEALRRDWAVLQVTPNQPLPRAIPDVRTNLAEGQGVKATGFPLGVQLSMNSNGPAVKALYGKLARVDRNDQQGIIRLTHNLTLEHGMSGGPLLRGRFLGWLPRIVGINVSAIPDSRSTENYALPTYLLQEKVFRTYGQ